MTASYTTGTVSVVAGNAVVTGVGTAWLTSGLVAGQFGLDSANGNPIPVLSIDSDTQITLVKPWRGTNAAGQAYWITYDTRPGQQTVSNAQKLAEYIARLDKPMLAALAGLIPAADKLAYSTGPNGAALMDFNAAARALLAGGVLPDGQLPQRLRGAGGPLVASFDDANQNGFYRATPTSTNGPPVPGFYVIWAQRFDNYIRQEIRSDVGSYFREGQIGALSAWKRNGPPERGGNANGEYVRFADGTQMCWGNNVFTNAANNRLIRGVTFPVAFVGGAPISPNGLMNLNSLANAGFDVNGSQSIFDVNISDLGASGMNLSMTSPIANISTGVNLVSFFWSAMGRWY